MTLPNIIYIHAHDLGRYCEPMGYDIPAPNLMKLAKEGVLFRQCHASAPSCAPSRAALLTGQHPHRCGMLGLPSPPLGYHLNDYNRHLAAFLKRHGYETALSGVQHVARAPWAPPRDVLPYDHFLNHEPAGSQEFNPGLTAPAAVEFLMQEHSRPFFLSVGFLDPHRNNRGDGRVFIESQPSHEPADIEMQARYCQPWPHMPDNAVTRRDMANFKMGVEMMDQDVGRVLKALDTPELRDNTIVIFTTDHGPGICEAKCTLTDRGTGVVLIIRGAANTEDGQGSAFQGGKVVDAMTQHLDLYPTIADIIGAEPPDGLDGKSLLPLVSSETGEIHETIFTEQTYHYNSRPRPLRAARTSRHKYIRSYKRDQARGIDRGPAEEFWAEYGYDDMPFPDEQLYDLVFDPHEAHNLAEAPTHAQVLDDMRQLMDRWMKNTDDPLIDGIIPDPPETLKEFLNE
ncbi:MAG: sulfatase [Verrucomicrobiota bacterium]